MVISHNNLQIWRVICHCTPLYTYLWTLLRLLLGQWGEVDLMELWSNLLGGLIFYTFGYKMLVAFLGVASSR